MSLFFLVYELKYIMLEYAHLYAYIGRFKMKDFDLKTKVFFGENALDHLLQKKSKNAMIIADPFTVKSGLIKYITDRLDKGNIPYKVFDDVVPDPPLEKVTVGV